MKQIIKIGTRTKGSQNKFDIENIHRRNFKRTYWRESMEKFRLNLQLT